MNNITDEETYRSSLHEYCLTVFKGTLIIPTVFGNILLLLSLFTHKTLRTRSNVLIGSLAVSDLLIGAIVLPYDVLNMIFVNLKDEKIPCLLQYTCFVTFVGASVTNLFIICLERYSAIMSPLKHFIKASKTRIFISITTGWTIAIILGLLPLLGWNIWTAGIMCKSKLIFTKGYLDLVLTFYTILIIISTILYSLVARKILKHLKLYKNGRVNHTSNACVNKNLNSSIYRNLKQTKIMIFILGLFAICWAPFTVLFILRVYFLEESNLVNLLKTYFTTFGLLNCALNWMIFGLMNNSTRKALNNILFCQYDEKITVRTISSTTTTC
ncbi:octopamine receptor-like [Mytilus trossulus]|uniref:octopamine receptor-like n=1 Tax=Mytilus trossulus TaxID=6551 RepID=UPI0030061662